MPERIPHLCQGLYQELYQDTEGIALVMVMVIMSVLLLVGTAALTNTATEYKISQNYRQSVHAFYDCEAGLAEAVAQIKNDAAIVDHGGDPNWIVASNSGLFKYRYYTTYNPPDRIYTITSEGKDPSQTANRRIIAEVKRLFCPADVKSPVYCGSGKNKGQSNTINGNSVTPAWADDGDPNNDTSAPSVITPNPYVSGTNPLNLELNQLSTTYPSKVEYNAPELDLVTMADYYRDLPPDRTDIPTGTTVTIGSPTDIQVVYINGNQTIAGSKTGYGVLVVTGDLHISGLLQWFGIVIVLGNNLIQTGGGVSGIQVTGAVMTPNHFEIRGNSDIQWSADVVRKVIRDTGDPLRLISWKED